MNISVIIPTYNRVHLLERCVDTLLAQSHPPHTYEIIIVDDCSTDGTRNYVSTLRHSTIRIYTLSKNQGPAAARNFGAQKAKYGILAFVDDDEEVPSDYLTTIARFFKLYPRGALTFRARAARPAKLWMRVHETCYPFDAPYIPALSMSKLEGLAIPRHIFLSIRGYTESFRLAEDTELLWRMKGMNIPVYLCTSVTLLHHEPERTFAMLKKKFSWGLQVCRLKKLYPEYPYPIPNTLSHALHYFMILPHGCFNHIRYARSFMHGMLTLPYYVLFRLAWIAGVLYGYRK